MSMNFDDEVSAIIFDNGSGTTKAGFAEDDAPRMIIPTIVGRQRHTTRFPKTSKTDLFIGDKALLNIEVLTIHYPIDMVL